MRKRLLGSAFALVLIVAPLAANAQTSTTPDQPFRSNVPSIPGLRNVPNIPGLVPLPNFPCPPTSQFMPLGPCDQLQKQIQQYNQYVALISQMQQMKQQLISQYATYPQQVLSGVTTDVQNMEAIVNKYQQLSYTSTTTAQDAANTMKDLYATVDPVASELKMQNMMQQTVEETLEKLHLADEQTKTDQSLVTKIQRASANATSPQQLLAMIVQLLAVMDAQLVRESQLHSTQIKAEANYELVKTASGGGGGGAGASVQNAQALSPDQLKAWLKTLNTVTPTAPASTSGSGP